MFGYACCGGIAASKTLEELSLHDIRAMKFDHYLEEMSVHSGLSGRN